jgi:beta-phosphoglucomutase
MSQLHPIFSGSLGVIFDLNGVLTTDEQLHEMAFAHTLAARSVTLTHADYQATILGVTDADGVARLDERLGLAITPAEQAQMVATKKQYYRDLLPQEAANYTMPGARDIVLALATRGILVSLASAAAAQEVDAWLRILDLQTVFDPIMTSESPIGAKPNPAVFTAIRDAWNLPSSACVVIDDMPENIAIAHSLDMRTIAVASTFTPADFPNADLIVPVAAELLMNE